MDDSQPCLPARILNIASSVASSSTFLSRIFICTLCAVSFESKAFCRTSRSNISCIAFRARSEMLRAPVALQTSRKAASSSSERRTLIERDRGLRTGIQDSNGELKSNSLQKSKSRKHPACRKKRRLRPRRSHSWFRLVSTQLT